MDNVGDGSPNHEFLILANLDGGKISIGSLQKNLLPVFPEALHGKFTVDHGDHDLLVVGSYRTVNDEDIARMDSGIPHRFTLNPDGERGGLVPDQLLIEIDGAFQMVIGW